MGFDKAIVQVLRVSARSALRFTRLLDAGRFVGLAAGGYSRPCPSIPAAPGTRLPTSLCAPNPLPLLTGSIGSIGPHSSMIFAVSCGLPVFFLLPSIRTRCCGGECHRVGGFPVSPSVSAVT